MKKINLTNLFICLAFFSAAAMVITGTLQNYIAFRGASNEIGFTLAAIFGGVMFLFGLKKDV